MTTRHALARIEPTSTSKQTKRTPVKGIELARIHLWNPNTLGALRAAQDLKVKMTCTLVSGVLIVRTEG